MLKPSLFLAALLFAAPVWASSAKTFWVATDGDDARSCATSETESTPQLTIKEGLKCLGTTSSDGGGHTVKVKDGTYGESGFNTNSAGDFSGGTSWSDFSTLTCESALGCIWSPTGCINFDTDQRYIQVDSWDLDGTSCGAGIAPISINDPTGPPAFPDAGFIRIQNNLIRNCDTNCIQLFGNVGSNEILNNKITNSGISGLGHAMYVQTDNNLIEGNDISNGTRAGIQIWKQTGSADDNIVRYNIVTDVSTLSSNKLGGILAGHGNRNKIEGNIVHNSKGQGIAILTSCNNCEISHNTVYNNTDDGIFISVNLSGAIVKNNISIDNDTEAIDDDASGTTLADNLTTGTATDIWVDPDGATPDFTLKSGSAAINNAADIGFGCNGNEAKPCDQGANQTFAHSTCVVEDGAATTLEITFDLSIGAFLPIAGLTQGDWTSRAAGSGNTITGITGVGDTRVDLTLTDAITNGQAVDYSYVVGDARDSADIGIGTAGTGSNQKLFAITQQSCTNNVGAASTFAREQEEFRFHELRGTEAAPVVMPHTTADDNTNIRVPAGACVRLRNTYKCNTATCPSVGLVLREDLDGAGYVVIPDSYSTENIKHFGLTDTSSDIPGQGTATTQLLSTDTFNAASIVRTSSAIPTIPEMTHTSPVDVTEIEHIFCFDTDAATNAVYKFRLYEQDSTPFTTYTKTGQVTIMDEQAGGGF